MTRVSHEDRLGIWNLSRMIEAHAIQLLAANGEEVELDIDTAGIPGPDMIEQLERHVAIVEAAASTVFDRLHLVIDIEGIEHG